MRVIKIKKCDLSLRKMEKKIKRDLDDGLDTYTAERMDLNHFFEKYMVMKKYLRPSTRENNARRDFSVFYYLFIFKCDIIHRKYSQQF